MAYSQLLSTYLATGTHAARPTTPNVAAGITCIYYETDTLNTFAWTGSSWAQINGGGSSGAMTQISKQSLGAAAATVSFSSIPGTYSALEIQYYCSGNNALADLTVQFNGDTAANYRMVGSEDFSSTVSQTSNATATYADGGLISGSSSTNAWTIGKITIPGYALTGGYHSCLSDSYCPPTGSSTTGYKKNTGSAWTNTAAITSIALSLTSGSFVSGSQFVLYGIN